MKEIYNRIIKNINSNPFVFIISGFVFVLAVGLGVFFGVNETSITVFTDNVCNYYLNVLALDSSVLAFLSSEF